MLKNLFPKKYGWFLSLPLLGTVLDDFSIWSLEQGYMRETRRTQLRAIIVIAGYLRRRGFQHVSEITDCELESCWTWYHRRDPKVASTVHVLQRFLQEKELLSPSIPESTSQTSALVSAYGEFLRNVRGLASSTISYHIFTARNFLDHLKCDTIPSRFASLTVSDVETFVRALGEKLSRASLQSSVAHIRGFLRFLATMGGVRSGLDTQIDTPRLYRFEKLPRALPWDTVRAFLESIDRRTPLGLRNYTMFFLMATYGLRSCEIISLTLDSINWRARQFQVPPRKNGSSLVLPLTDDAGTVLLDYLRRGRPPSPYRELFLRMRAPAGGLTGHAVGRMFKKLLKRSGLNIPLQGPHCLRHSYAVHLLRRGTSLKTIGDLLGHRLTESTCMYLRLAIEDLRGVALSVPREFPD